MKYDALMPNEPGESHSAEISIRPQPIAPWFHTVFLLVVLTLWATSSALRLNLPANVMSHYVTYTSSIVIQCLLVGSTIAGLYHRRQFIISVLGPFTRQNLLRDLAIGIATYIGALCLLAFLNLAIRLTPLHLTHKSDVVLAMAPHTPTELTLWMVVSLAAGICEEFVFRGYLQRQLTCWFRSVPIAIGVASLFFGCLHSYQGTAGVLQVTALGLIYGIIAAWRGNLRSVMIAHFLQDAITGAVIYMRHH
jgi:membrane protease YdiL (CAAX protease family)